MKKFFFSLVALFCLLSQSLSAYSEKIGDIYYIFSGETAIVTYLYANGDDVDSRNQIAYKGTITIPSTVTSQTGKTYRVTGIGRHAFSYCTELTNVKIGSNVKSIGKDAFCNCTELKSVEFPNKQITTIEYSAFYQCESLEKIGDVSEVSTLGDDAFYRCYNIKNLNFSNKLTSIGYRAFCECKKLENVGDLSNVNSIGNIAFQYCESLRNGDNGIDLRNVQSLNANGNIFRGCKNLERIIISSKLKVIPDYTFDNCTNLKEIVAIDLENGIPKFSTIGPAAFRNCNSLQQLPDFSLLTEIPKDAFNGCSSITTVYIPDNVKKVGDRAFQGCFSRIINGNQYIDRGVKSVTGGNGLTYIGNNVFQGDSMLSIVRIGIPIDNWQKDGITSYIGINIAYINQEAFSGCRNLQNIRLSMSSTKENEPYVGNNSFNQCKELKTVKFTEGLIRLDQGAFQYCESLDNVKLPSTLKSLGNQAFKGCKSLIGGGVFVLDQWGNATDGQGFGEEKPADLKILGTECFAETKIKEIKKLHSSYTTVSLIRRKKAASSEGVFYLPYGVEVIGEKAFSSCKNLESIALPASVQSIEDEAFWGCEKLASIDIPASVSKVQGNAFNGTAWYDNQPDGMIYLGTTAYKYKGWMQNETSITIKDGTKHIGSDAFAGKDRLIGITFPSSLKSIGNGAFRNCYGLSSINMPEGVEFIGKEAFWYCNGLACAYIPQKVESIGQYTFGYCSSLSKVAIPANVETIDAYAFTGCSNLKDIYMFCETPPSTSQYTFENNSYANTTVHVPSGCLQKYQTANIWKAFMNIVEEELDWSATISHLKPEVEPDFYYLYHPASGKYIKDVYDQYTPISLGESGGTFFIRAKGNSYLIKNKDNKYLDWTDLRLYSYETNWYLVKQTDGSFALTGDNSQYLCYDGQLKKTNDPTNKNAHWLLVTRNDIINGIMASASREMPCCVPFISNADFEIKESGEQTAWKGNPTINGKAGNLCAEKYNCTFDVYQTLTDLPNGFYKIKVQGFYREGANSYNDISSAVEKHKSGNEHLYAKLYANGKEKSLMSIFEEADKCSEGFSCSLGIVPNSMSHASAFFSKDLYWNEVITEVTDGTLRMGVRSTTSVEKDWACFDSFRLYYYGNEDPSPTTIIAKNYTRQYGEPNPKFEFITECQALNGTPEIVCEASTTSPVGTYDIVVKPGSVTNHNLVCIKGTLTIAKAPLNIAAGTYTKKHGEAMPDFTLSYTGFKNNETKAVLTKLPTVSCSATESSEPGEYPITVSGAEAQNYDISYSSGKLVVNQADLVTITAKNYTREYGETNPTFEFTTTGAVLDGTPEIVCEATTTSPVGTYDIVVKQGSVKNYNVAYEKGTLTITKAPLTITAGTYTKQQGAAMPEFDLTYAGFKNGETSAVLTKQPIVSCSATETSEPGEYPIIVSGAKAQNYDISYTNGKLVVTKADAITITAKSYTREYGDENPTFEYTVEGGTLDGEPEITCSAKTSYAQVGTYDIVLTRGTVKNYDVTFVNGTLTIEKAPLTIDVGTYSKKQGEAMPKFEPTYIGFKNGQTRVVLKKYPVVTCEANANSAPGEYPVIASGAEAKNYEISYVDGKLIVTDADPITITAKDCSREYGDANPTFEFTTEGAALVGTPEISCEASATSPVGSYDIVVKQGSVKNFNATFVNGTLAIEKAPLTVSVQDCARNQGEENPTFVLIYSGWKNSEDESVLTVKPVATTTATKDSPAGEYVITVDDGDAPNYTFDYVNGILTVSEASAITQISTNEGEAQNYDVLGRKGNSSAKGLLIRDGKVMLVR